MQTYDLISRCRELNPLVHCISNYVSANDCANLLLACGASPIMADDPHESADITAASRALVINLGTPNPRKLEAITRSAKKANETGIPVVLDPVGVGASPYRMEFVRKLLTDVRISVIRGNASEVEALLHGQSLHHGVDTGTDAGRDRIRESARTLAEKFACTVVVSGKADIVTDEKQGCLVRNGHPMMKYVTGSGCQLSALIGAFAAVCPESPLSAALYAAVSFGLCGEMAVSRLTQKDGSAAMRQYLIDAMFRMDHESCLKGARYEVF